MGRRIYAAFGNSSFGGSSLASTIRMQFENRSQPFRERKSGYGWEQPRRGNPKRVGREEEKPAFVGVTLNELEPVPSSSSLLHPRDSDVKKGPPLLGQPAMA
jgi:hypothetical protein